MERKIGEIFECENTWYQCVKGDTCKECDLISENCKARLGKIGFCSSYARNDERQVVFKKLEKVGEPFERNGYMYQEYKAHTYPLLMSGGAKIPTDNGFAVIIKQNKEDMEEKYKAENTPLTRLVGRYVNNLIDYNVFEKAVKELYADKEESKPNLKPFNLEAAKAGNPVCTRDGRKARIICFDAVLGKGNNLIALISNGSCESLEEYELDGRYYFEGISEYDLMMLPEKKEGWVNVYHNEKGEYWSEQVLFSTKKEAIDFVHNHAQYVTTVKIEWEE